MTNNKIGLMFIFWALLCSPLFTRDIRVSIVKGDKNVIFDGKALSVSLSGKKGRQDKVEFRVSGTKLFVNKNGLKEIKSAHISSGNPVKVNGRSYRGSFEVLMRNGSLYVVNVIDIEKYLYGVIKSEILISSHPEALKAQAVVARTYAIQHKGKHAAEGFDLCNTTHCQMYCGLSEEDPRARTAVDSTRGCIISYQGMPVSVFFSSNCGGVTCSNTDAWGSTLIPYLDTVKDPYCSSEYGYSWEYMTTPEELALVFARKGLKIGTPVEILIVKKNPSERVQTLKLIGTEGEASIDGKQLRSMIGYKEFKSENFEVEKIGVAENVNDSIAYAKEKMNVLKIIRSTQQRKENESKSYFEEGNVSGKLEKHQDRVKMLLSRIEAKKKKYFKFAGNGYGHGVGMCQSGARVMANKGMDFSKILEFYFKKTRLKKIY